MRRARGRCGGTILAAILAAILATPAFCAAGAAPASYPRYATVIAGRILRFPQDFGSHPEFRTEWWYVTGWLTAGGQPLGFQITFFRTKPEVDENNPSAFAAHQMLIAHAAISDPARGRLWSDQRIRRAGLGLASAETGDTNVWIGRWTLRRESGIAQSTFLTDIDSEEMSLHLRLAVTQPPLLNGEAGFSRKGPEAGSASYYYSIPHLKVSGTVKRGGGGAQSVVGEAWLDHEWSSEYLDADAAGWEWTGINLDDGSALMAFRIRALNGRTLWSGGSLRDKSGRTQILTPSDVRFTPLRAWKSPRTGIAYPVAWRLQAGTRQLDLTPLMDDQENDARLSTGAIYWEGAVSIYDAHRLVGRGYLELTGYGERLRLR